MEVHHIKAHADSGSDTFNNAIPLCFDCNAEVHQYDSKHPKGINFLKKNLFSTETIGIKKCNKEIRVSNNRM